MRPHMRIHGPQASRLLEEVRMESTDRFTRLKRNPSFSLFIKDLSIRSGLCWGYSDIYTMDAVHTRQLMAVQYGHER